MHPALEVQGMAKALEAVYESGLLRPFRSLIEVPEHARVTMTLCVAAPNLSLLEGVENNRMKMRSEFVA